MQKKIPLEILINNLAELDAQIPAIAEALAGRRKIALYGNLGSGKTTLVQAFCRWLGVEDSPTSPTFSLINEYGYRDATNQPALVHHLDLYRLNSTQEAFDIGIEEILDDPWYCFIEWPQLVEPMLPDDAAKIQLEILSETARRLLIL
ncbi:MAG: tRNA (adenosine(37)-N6)-threonylcarbamoyltransferase complex ATPase subunit type 1 TsaE [Lewinellaceae bacterium]|nr:tRNA (adenosine(37)-N6)-threonylcarbamoyltransferase complex ATPase subunit type 1 TsaE [Lewinellaceae bacterium]